tara:strand:- start:44 stop:523 length:480 start_codon:yes stop_codon:yes gene_type:complete
MSTSKDNHNNDLAVGYSANLIKLLNEKMRAHNKENPSGKVSLSQLKQVFINSAEKHNYAGYTRGQWACARVNTFLRILKGEKPKIVTGRETATLGGLVFEAKIIVSEEHDASSNWVPSQEDFTKARLEIEKNDLIYNFTDIEELYLESYRPMGIVIKSY